MHSTNEFISRKSHSSPAKASVCSGIDAGLKTSGVPTVGNHGNSRAMHLGIFAVINCTAPEFDSTGTD